MCSRPTTAPDFLLSRADGSVRTQGAKITFSDPHQAISLLSSGNVEMIVGALPFHPGAPAALTVPEKIIREDHALEPHPYYRIGPGAQLKAHLVGVDPSPQEHRKRVAHAVDAIQRRQFDKVVLARAVDIAFDPAVDPRLVAARLIELSAQRDAFIADLSPAGEEFHGKMLVGSSPEVLVRRRGQVVTAFPLAGSAPRQTDAQCDAKIAQRLQASAKDQSEHAYVVEHLRRVLTPLCFSLSIPDQPELMKTNEVWHLATPIRGELREPAPSALELAMLTHPTPAICGTPATAAERFISDLESPRGFYAGAVGWCDSHGDGQYMVAIRCAEVSADGYQARAWAGGGIVADSDPETEFAETTAKLRTIMRALGLRDDVPQTTTPELLD
ncbi:isochorismate synthase [Corynebacterium poyangense]|uniref:isochorismate synthase n=1 Tax=Corynebacterium poyangense TaxID=2684405 RepID=A0A7H0SNI5_9CORY|nr:isochorismate synthase [Corynebacterium poyangense]QNQ90110.1 isochorismate synthase [Corynebacterium poyangense]